MKLIKNRSSITKPRIPWYAFAFCSAVALLYLQFGAIPDTLIYNRSAIEDGEIWRLISCHFVHCDLSHLGWNLVALFILSSVLERHMGIRVSGVILFCCLGVSGWLWFVKTELLLYCGLSGILNGLLSVVLFVLWRENKHPILPLLAVAAVAKIIIESSTQQAIFTDLSWQSVPGAHGAGIFAGLCYLLITMAAKGAIPKTRISGACAVEHDGQDFPAESPSCSRAPYQQELTVPPGQQVVCFRQEHRPPCSD